MKQLLVLFLLMHSLTFAYAEEGYRFQSELEFKHDSSIVAGQLENYSLYTNENVKLLIGFLEDKNFLEEVGKMSQADIKEKFYSQARFYDPLNNQSQRTLISFKITKNNLFTKVEMEYRLLKENVEWNESNVYVLGPKSTAFAALQFPADLAANDKNELQKGMHDFSLQDDKVVESSVKTFNKITFEALTAYSAKRMSNLLTLGSFFVSESFADETSKETGCDTKKYIVKGDFSTKKGSALFNFQKLSHDIQEEAAKEKPSDKEITCLSKFYKRAKDDASTYWSERGVKEGCLGSNGEPLSKKQKTCSDSTYNEMNASFKYIDNVDKNLNDFLVGKVASEASCEIKKPDVSEQMQVFSKLNSNIQQTFCCSNGSGSLDKGPLFTILESDDTFKKLSPTAQTEMCLLKTKTENKSFASPTGMVDCLQSMVDGIANVVKGLIKTIVSVFDVEFIKALGQFVANLPKSAVDMVKTIGEHIGAQIYSVTDCMSPYEANVYMCKMVPNVAAMLLGPGLVKNFIKALADKTAKTALAEIIVSAAKGNKQFQRMQAASASVAAGGRKIASGAMKIKAVRVSAAALGKIASILGKDVSTPIKDMVASKAKAAYANATLKAKTAAEKILKRKKVDNAILEELADVDAPLRNTARSDITNLEEGADGIVSAVPLTNAAVPAAGPTLSANANVVVENIADYKRALAAGNTTEAATIKKQMQEAAKKLGDEERVAVAKAVTGKSLKEKGIVEAHEVGGTGRELGSYNQSELRQKARKAQSAGVNKQNRRDLMEAGVLGGDSAGAISKAISIETPSGRIAAKVLKSEGDSHLIEYMGVNGKIRYQKTFTTEQLNSMGMRAEPVNLPVAALEVPAAKPADLNSVFDDIEREAKERTAAMQVTKTTSKIEDVAPEKVPEKIPAISPERTPSTFQERVENAQKSNFVNGYGVPKADLEPGRIVKVKVRTMDGVKEVEGEIINGMHLDSVSGMPSIQLKYADGVITETNNVMRGKLNYKIDSIGIDTIEELRPKVIPKEVVIEQAPVKPINKTVKTPSTKELDPTSYDGRAFRTQADSDALNTLLKEQRVGERTHIASLEQQLRDDNLLRMKASSPNREITQISKYGKFNDPRFDPKIYYADIAEEFNSALNAADKFSPNGMPLEAAELRLKGRISYNAEGKAERVGSARDEIRTVMKNNGKTPDQIKEVEDWMDRYDETIPRKRNVEKAKAAQAAFEKLKPKFEGILRGETQVIAQSTFEDMTTHLKDMMLRPEKREAAEAALRRIKCSRPEWKIGDSYKGFDLKCH
jgi:hypothetical protein